MKKDVIEHFYERCKLIRRVEEEIERLYPSDKIKSPVHLSIGQECVSVAACSALDKKDIVFSNYRGHAAYLAKGGNLRLMFAELFGKVDGCAAGKAGSMHLIDNEVGFMGTSAIVATSIPNAVGYAWALKQQKKENVVLNFFGDGATDEGVFFESLNFASLKKVPIIFVCENNDYAIYSSVKERNASASISAKAELFQIPVHVVDDGNIFSMSAAVQAAKKKLIDEPSGPVFVEIMTSRWRDHVGPGNDDHIGYREKLIQSWWYKNDQVEGLSKLITPAARDKIDEKIELMITDAINFAEASSFPEDEALMQHLYYGE